MPPLPAKTRTPRPKVSIGSFISGALPELVKEIEIRSRFAPPVVMRVEDLIAEGPPGPATRILKPTVILRGGSLGTQILAPAGETGRNDWRIPTAAVAAGFLLGILAIFGIGVVSGRR